MTTDPSGVLVPFDFSLILQELPALRGLFLDLTVISFDRPIDSSNVKPEHWKLIGQIIYDHYDEQDGFVVLHGTDTMAYTSSSLSFMLSGLQKPVVFTGAQLPIGEPRSDARENLITSLEIAAARKNGHALVPEVCLYFDYTLLRGSRSKKVESMHFDAFESGNYPPLAKAGVAIDYNFSAIRTSDRNQRLKLLSTFDANVTILKLFPGIGKQAIQAALSITELKAVVLETFGSGNAPTDEWLLEELKNAIQRGLIILNISQCSGGMVIPGKYETSRQLKEIGVIGGRDMTTEAAITKLMLLIGEYGIVKARELIAVPLAGELTP